MKADEAYKGYYIPADVVKTDVHVSQGCVKCHGGDENSKDKDKAHASMVKRPSDNLKLCAPCHAEIAKNYESSLHYQTHGLNKGVSARFSEHEKKIFEDKVFKAACNSCHASCGDCHVRGPVISGISIGLIDGHRFVRKAEAKTCAACHGGRVYPEFTGEYGGTADVHYQRGMYCMDCHKVMEFHGDGKRYESRKDIPYRPSCIGCHPASKTEKSKLSHARHGGKVSCYACHTASLYRNCYDCHLGKGAQPKPDMILGLNPRDKKTVTTLRVVPTIKETFKDSGIAQEKFDSLPNYWDTTPHNIAKRTSRTRSCDFCHVEQQNFLKKDNLLPGGSKANEELIKLPPSRTK